MSRENVTKPTAEAFAAQFAISQHYRAGCGCPRWPTCVAHGWAGEGFRDHDICADHEHLPLADASWFRLEGETEHDWIARQRRGEQIIRENAEIAGSNPATAIFGGKPFLIDTEGKPRSLDPADLGDVLE